MRGDILRKVERAQKRQDDTDPNAAVRRKLVEYRAEIDRLRGINVELLEACKIAAVWVPHLSAASQKCYAAIARAEGYTVTKENSNAPV